MLEYQFFSAPKQRGRRTNQIAHQSTIVHCGDAIARKCRDDIPKLRSKSNISHGVLNAVLDELQRGPTIDEFNTLAGMLQ